jgi:tryptophan-rich sensory protein
LALNFAALAIGGLFTSNGVPSDWYVGIAKAPWTLNVGWNPTFFYYHNVLAGLLLIIGLTALIGFFLFFYWPELKLKSALILPYFIWLLIATSLNGYIFLKN